MPEVFPILISVVPEDAGKRLDQFLAARLEAVSRARVQELISEEKVLVNDTAAKASLKLHGGERISVLGEAQRPPLRAMAEDIPLDIVYEDDDLAVINKPAGMMVHVGAGATEDKRNRGTLVNALLHHFASLSSVSGDLRPGIVHRLDKETSGLIVVAKNDEAHSKLAAQFAGREVQKTYVALKPRSCAENSNDHTAVQRAAGDHALPSGSTYRYRVRQIHSTRSENRDRQDASDSRALGFARLPGRGRCHVRSAPADTRPCRSNVTTAKFFARSGTGVAASADR